MQWYEDEVKQLEQIRLTLHPEPGTIFYGSSSIRLWESLNKDFAAIDPINLGFGGSTLAACVWFFERLIAPYHPKRLIIYAGDNDLGDGRHPEEVLIFFQELTVKVNQYFGQLPCYFISLKPSPSRWSLVDQFKQTNSLIEKEIAGLQNWQYIDIFSKMLNEHGLPVNEYFLPDGLHLSSKGYLVWKLAIEQALK